MFDKQQLTRIEQSRWSKSDRTRDGNFSWQDSINNSESLEA